MDKRKPTSRAGSRSSRPAATVPPVQPADRGLRPEVLSSLALEYVATLGRLEEAFFAHPDGASCARDRAAAVDALVTQVFAQFYPQPAGVALCAIGGYGRRELFPFSDVDLLLLFSKTPEGDDADVIRAFLQALWDAHLRVSHTVRTPAECGALHEGNAEFTISLLDVRPLTGDEALPQALGRELLPRMLRRERTGLLRRLNTLIAERHAKYSNTVYHLEPSIKDSPGGLRDLQAIAWWQTILDSETQLLPQIERWPLEQRPALSSAHAFLATIRTFLHYLNGRDLNVFSYDMQERLSTEARWGGRHQTPEQWMREYFGHARLIDRRLRRELDISAGKRNTLFRFVLQRKNAIATADFTVNGGAAYFRNPRFVEQQPAQLVDIFRFGAEHQVPLSDAAEATVIERLPLAREAFRRAPESWLLLRGVLLSQYAYRALRAMHQVGLLTAIVPEFAAIDCLVLRDFYHRYTVDEHSLLTIDVVHRLRRPSSERRRQFGELYKELESPELLLAALLLHDIGKGISADDHVAAGAQALEGVLARWALDERERETIRFLVLNHLVLSRALRRDIFDSDNVRHAAQLTATEDRLKMLTVMTLADIEAVHPEALTPWKEDNLWQLYIGAYNELTHGVDRDRIGGAQLDPFRTARDLLAHASPESSESLLPELSAYLRGLPRRYLVTHSPTEILEHFRSAQGLAADAVVVRLNRRKDDYDLTIVAHDRPGLFATATGALSASGANIIKAEAFGNAQGLIVDTFRFIDLHRTIELNAGEAEHLRQRLQQALTTPGALDRLRAPAQKWFARRAGPPIATRIAFDSVAGGKQTLLEIVARDRPGLLFDISRVLAEAGCDIAVALIDTEATKAIDVFYITAAGAALPPKAQETLRSALQQALG